MVGDDDDEAANSSKKEAASLSFFATCRGRV